MAGLPRHPTGTIPHMASLLFSVDADRRLTALAADAGRQELYNRVNDILDLIEDNPGNPRLRRRRYQQLWVPETQPWSLTCRDAGRC